MHRSQHHPHNRCTDRPLKPGKPVTISCLRRLPVAQCVSSMQQQDSTSPTPTNPGSNEPSSSSSVQFLGRGPQHIPRIGLGLAALGRPGYINLGHGSDLTDTSASSSGRDVENMRQHCWQMLDEAWVLGVRYFDAARSYGRAEEFLSGWLQSRGVPADAVVVGSKWGYTYTADWQVDTGGAPHEVKEHTADNLVKQAAETQQHLDNHLDLYQIHSATLESGVLQSQPVVEQLAELKASRAWRIGLSVSGVQQHEVIEQAIAVKTASGQRLFDCVQATWNLLEQSAGPALLQAHQAGMSVIIKEAMANGRLTPRNTDPSFAAQLELLCKTSQEFNSTPDALALACVLQQPFQPMVLSGAATVEQLRQNYAALELAERLPDDVLLKLQEALQQPSQQYWDKRAGLTWN